MNPTTETDAFIPVDEDYADALDGARAIEEWILKCNAS